MRKLKERYVQLLENNFSQGNDYKQLTASELKQMYWYSGVPIETHKHQTASEMKKSYGPRKILFPPLGGHENALIQVTKIEEYTMIDIWSPFDLTFIFDDWFVFFMHSTQCHFESINPL
jgi:hypothetical protein